MRTIKQTGQFKLEAKRKPGLNTLELIGLASSPQHLKPMADKMAERLFGWWLFDTETSAIMHETTGQVVRHVGRPDLRDLGLSESQNRIWMRFEYSDSDIRFPILIEWRNIPSKIHGRPLVWRVDYVRSAALWKREKGVSSDHLPYGLWCRVDDCLTDALASWPAHPKTGAKPQYIGFNAGWLNGAWTDALYRRVWCSGHLITSTDAFQNPSLPELAVDAPSPWVMVAPSVTEPEYNPSTWNVPDGKAWSEVQSALRCQHYLTTEDRSRLLVALPKAEIRLHLKRMSRLLYIDKNIVTDALHIGVYDSRPSELPTWTTGFAKDTAFPLLDRLTGAPIPWVASNSRMPTGITVRVDHMPYAVTRKLGRAVLDALLPYPDVEWMPPETPDTAGKVSSTPSIAFMSEWELGGSVMPSRLEATKSLEPLNDRPNQLAYMFDQNDGINRSATVFETAGYWRFDPSTQSLCNSVSGQRVTFQGAVPHDRSATSIPGVRKAWRFQYDDDDHRYPIVVLPALTSGRGALQCVWFIDHDQSLLLWRQLPTGGSVPAFGLWQRVNECVVDALLCWPEVESTGPKPIRVVSMAGWFNGAWSSQIRRRSQPGYDHGFAKHITPVPAFLTEVTAQSYPWTFLDSSRAARGARLANVEEIGPAQLYLPPDEKLTGFEADVPHLIRSDGQAVMFPAGLKSTLHRGEDYLPGAFFCYADSDVFFLINGGEFVGWKGLPSDWTFNSANPFQIGLRHLEWFDASRPGGIPADLFTTSQSRFGPVYATPSPSVWQRVATALIDGWLVWTGSSNRLLDDPSQLEKLRGRTTGVPGPEKSGIDLGRKAQVRIEGGYLGGRFNTMHSTTAWIEQIGNNTRAGP
jgi:hypothetical protein